TCAAAFTLAVGDYVAGNTSLASDQGALGTCTAATGGDVYYSVTLPDISVVGIEGAPPEAGLVSVGVAPGCRPPLDSCISMVSSGPGLSTFTQITGPGTFIIRVRVSRGGSDGGDFILSVRPSAT